MKRAREQGARIPKKAIIAAPAPSPAAVSPLALKNPLGSASSSTSSSTTSRKIKQRTQRKEEPSSRSSNNGNSGSSRSSSSSKQQASIPHPVAPLPPPPPIQPFSDDSDEGESAPVSASSSSSTYSFPEPETKKVKIDPKVEEWRKAAEAILAGGPVSVGKGLSRRNFAVVCSSNVNRSIMAQILLEKNDMRAKSYGTGREVKLPGKDYRSPQSFPFGTPYVEIRDFLANQNEELFRRNSVLGLLERDAATKRAPERWQALGSEEVASFDVVVCFESRVFDLVVEDLHRREPDTFKPLHVVSMTIRDSAEDSAAAAGHVLELCKMLDECDDLDNDASKLLNGFRIGSKRTVLHQVCHI